jgi:hypothetical protein
MKNETDVKNDTPMEDAVTTIFVLCDKLLSALNQKEDTQARMSDAEVMLTVVTAADVFHGHWERARVFLKAYGDVMRMLRESRLNRRIPGIPEYSWGDICRMLAETVKAVNTDRHSCLDRFPVPVWEKLRITRCRLYAGEECRGDSASKRRYFYGVRVHMLVTEKGEPVEGIVRPGAESDVSGSKDFKGNRPSGATGVAERMYTDSAFEDLLREAVDIDGQASRKKHATRRISDLDARYKQVMRKRVEPSFRHITACFPKTIPAGTSRGVELKIVLFIVAFSIQGLL